MAEVSRETPPEAELLFPEGRLGLAEQFVELLATDGVVRGLIGPREGPRLWSRHILNCAAVAELVPAGSSVCDLGSGAGLPGLVLALARPDLRVTLVEPLQRRCAFLEETVATLGLSGVEIVRARAEALHGTRVFDVVTARALAPLGRLLDWALPLLAPGGQVLAMKGGSAASEVEDAAATLARWGCPTPEVIMVGEQLGTASTTVVRVMWAGPERGRLAAGPPGGKTVTRRQQSRKRQVP